MPGHSTPLNVRRDLRIEDSMPLAAAARDFNTIVPIFTLDDYYRDDPTERRASDLSVRRG
jgi:deoxyribodipyrimidine photolyase